MNLKQLFLASLVGTVVLTGCSSNETPETETETPGTQLEETGTGTETETTEGFTGTAKLERLYDATGAKTDVVVTEITFENGTPTDLSIDVLMDGQSKKELAMSGEYDMKNEGGNWAEQMELLEAYIVENDFDTTKVNISTDAGNTDAVTGVSIKVATYLTFVDELIANVKEGKTEQTGFTGVESAEQTVEGSTDVIMVDVVFDNGTPVNLVIDTKTDAGMKRELVEAGEYVMANESATWTEQVDALAAFIVANNFDLDAVTLSTDAGNTDAVAGVSIKVGGYLPVIQAALDQVK
ncbi:MAG TPA: hypothetical protein DCY20_00310 [Firmicutes bacterium]|nr:hypothetical protein [Bacillota bacterium]